MHTTISGWQLRRVSGPDVEPLSLEEARGQLKLDADLIDENDSILDWIRGARELAEAFTKQTFVESEWELTLNSFPTECFADGRIILPRGPIIAVLGVSYLDHAGTRVALADGDWLEALHQAPAYICPPYRQFWPSGRCMPGAVQINYRAGYRSAGSPTDAANVPAAVRATMRAIVTKWYENRQMVDVDDLLNAGLFHLRALT